LTKPQGDFEKQDSKGTLIFVSRHPQVKAIVIIQNNYMYM